MTRLQFAVSPPTGAPASLSPAQASQTSATRAMSGFSGTSGGGSISTAAEPEGPALGDSTTASSGPAVSPNHDGSAPHGGAAGIFRYKRASSRSAADTSNEARAWPLNPVSEGVAVQASGSRPSSDGSRPSDHQQFSPFGTGFVGEGKASESVGFIPVSAESTAGSRFADGPVGTANSEARSRVVVSAEELVENFKESLVSQLERELEEKGETLTVMCIGECGAGKTTLISSLFVQPIPRRSVSTQSTREIEETVVDLVMGKDKTTVNVHVRMIDSPGYGDDVDIKASFRRITDYIEGSFDAVLAKEREECRPDYGELDRMAGVDAVLYFIAPHRLKQLDIEFLRCVHTLAPVLPIIAKADTLTTEELAVFRKDVSETLEREKINVYAGPFAVICCAVSATTAERGSAVASTATTVGTAGVGDGTNGGGAGAMSSSSPSGDVVTYARGRQYPWGTALADNPLHSDLPLLRATLLTDGLVGLHAARRACFERYRRKLAAAEREARAALGARARRALRWMAGIVLHAALGVAVVALVRARLESSDDEEEEDGRGGSAGKGQIVPRRAREDGRGAFGGRRRSEDKGSPRGRRGGPPRSDSVAEPRSGGILGLFRG